MKISIQLKESNLAYCYNQISGQSINQFGDVAFELQRAIKENSLGDVDLTVSVEPAMILEIYDRASKIAEGYGGVINNEIKTALVPQLITLAENNKEVATLLQSLSGIDNKNKAMLDADIQLALQKIKA